VTKKALARMISAPARMGQKRGEDSPCMVFAPVWDRAEIIAEAQGAGGRDGGVGTRIPEREASQPVLY